MSVEESRRAILEDEQIARQCLLESALRARLVELFSDFKKEFAETFTHIEVSGEGELAKIVLEAVEECIEEPDWLEYLAEMFQTTVAEARSSPDGFVYVLKAGDLYKIGRARRLTPRIKQLRIQLPFPVTVWNAFPCEDHVASERYLHQFFARHRVNGEWFRLPEVAVDPSYGWLARCKYMSRARGEYVASCGDTDYHTRIPAALLHDERWGKAFSEAEAAREEAG